VPITQEEEPGETSTLAFDDFIPNPQEGDLESRNTLDTIFLNQLGTHPQDDRSKNDLDTCEQEEGMGQPEIDIPMTELSTNIDPSHTSPFRIDTLSVDDDQQKAKSLEHTGNFSIRELSTPNHGTEQADATTVPQKPLIDKEQGLEPTLKREREPAMEHLYTVGILGNTLSWGDQQIPEPIDEFVDIHAISYTGKGKL
jgi:hypothetical protein